VSASADLVGHTGLVSGSNSSGDFDLRGAELLLYGPIDPWFSGALSLAAHPEDGKKMFEVHEAWLESSRLLPRSRLRAGQLFLGLGRLGVVHAHEWPMTQAPYFFRQFFGSEGLLDVGVEGASAPFSSSTLEIVYGVSRGWTLGHSHSAGAKPLVPTHWARVSHFWDAMSGGSLLGLNYMGRTDASGQANRLLGMDYSWKLRHGKILRHSIQSELWHRRLQSRGSNAEYNLGSYVMYQYGLSERWMLSTTVEYFSNWSLKTLGGESISNYRWGFTPAITIKPSEFSKFRLSYFLEQNKSGSINTSDHQLWIQTTFQMGSHPSHDF
jgi:hypothetical protein